MVNGSNHRLQGSVMIRPVVGNPLKVTSVNDTYYRNKNLINIWPNPATDFISINSGRLQLSGFLYNNY